MTVMQQALKEVQFDLTIQGKKWTIHSVNPFQAVRSAFIGLGLKSSNVVTVVSNKGFKVLFVDVRLTDNFELQYTTVYSF